MNPDNYNEDGTIKKGKKNAKKLQKKAKTGKRKKRFGRSIKNRPRLFSESG